MEKVNRDITRDDLFFCYSRQLSDFIWMEGNIEPLTIAINPKTNVTFSLYAKNDKLKKVLDKYRTIS